MGDKKEIGPRAYEEKTACYASLLFGVRRSVVGNSGIVGERFLRLLHWV